MRVVDVDVLIVAGVADGSVLASWRVVCCFGAGQKGGGSVVLGVVRVLALALLVLVSVRGCPVSVV